MKNQPTKPIYTGARIEKRTIELEAEVTAKGQVFLILPKSRFKAHRDNVHRFMIQDLEASE